MLGLPNWITDPLTPTSPKDAPDLVAAAQRHRCRPTRPLFDARRALMHQFDLTVTLYPADTDTATHAAIIAAVDLVAEVVAEVHPDPTRTKVDSLVQTPVRLTERGWADEVDLPELLTVTRDALDAAVSSSPGLAGWWVLAVPTDALPADHPHRSPSHPRPTGPEADAAYRASVLAAADRFAAFPLDRLTDQDPPDSTELDQARAQVRHDAPD